MFTLTGDVHHMSLHVQDQFRLPPGATEASLCGKYLEIANSCGIAPTIYATGRCVDEEEAMFLDLIRRFRFELGGHTYTCYKPRLLYGGSRRVLGLANGPKFVQRHDIMKTIASMSRFSKASITSWRNHAYREDRNTVPLLSEHGITSVSNLLSMRTGPSVRTLSRRKIVLVPINTPADHENLHPDGKNQYARYADVSHWAEDVLAHVRLNELAGIHSIILAHPACMEVEDSMNSLKYLLRSLSSLDSLTMDALAKGILAAHHA